MSMLLLLLIISFLQTCFSLIDIVCLRLWWSIVVVGEEGSGEDQQPDVQKVSGHEGPTRGGHTGHHWGSSGDGSALQR